MWIWPWLPIGGMIFFWTFFQNVDQLSQYLTSKYISKSNCVLHVGEFYQKNHFFGSRFFKFHQHVIHFLCKKRAKKRLPVVIFIKKISEKMKKNKKNLSHFPDMWHDLDITNTLNFKKSTYWWFDQKNSKNLWKSTFFGIKIPIFDTNVTQKSTFSRNIYIWVILTKMMQYFQKVHFMFLQTNLSNSR